MHTHRDVHVQVHWVDRNAHGIVVSASCVVIASLISVSQRRRPEMALVWGRALVSFVCSYALPIFFFWFVACASVLVLCTCARMGASTTSYAIL